MLIESGSKLVMIGDSITDCGRAQPVGEGLFGAIGNGYSIMIGTNDVWRQFDSPLQSELHVPYDKFESTLDVLVRDTLPTLKGLVLIDDPVFFGTE